MRNMALLKAVAEEPKSTLRLEAYPRDVGLRADTLVILHANDELSVHWMDPRDGHWVETTRCTLEGLPTPNGMVWREREDGFEVLDLTSGVLKVFSQPCGELSRSLYLPGPSPDLYVGTRLVGDMPRSHGRVTPLGVRYLLEAREFGPQETRTETTAYLLAVTPAPTFDDVRTDTLASLPASSYSHRRGGLMVCCGWPPMFSRQAHWVPGPDGTVMIVTNFEPAELFVHSDAVINQLDWHPLPTREITSQAILEYVYHRNLVMRPDWSARQLRRFVRDYRSRLEEPTSPARTVFADMGPRITQMLPDGTGRLWFRGFDPRAWPLGLADEWAVLTDTAGLSQPHRLPPLGLVYVVRADGKEVLFVDAVQSRPSEVILRVLRFGEEDLRTFQRRQTPSP